MESVLAAAITGVLTLIGVLYSNSRSKAVIELKIDLLSDRVQKHNELISRTYQLESTWPCSRPLWPRSGRTCPRDCPRLTLLFVT